MASWGIKCATLSSHTKLINSTNISNWNDTPNLLYTLLGCVFIQFKMKTVKFFMWYIGAKPKNIKDVIQLIKLVIRQKITELWCKRKHNQWVQIQPYLHGAGKYVYNGYKCNVCGRIHIAYEVNS